MAPSIQEIPEILHEEVGKYTSPVPSSLPRAGVSRYTSYLIFTLCSVVYLLPFTRLLLRGTDEGTLVYGATRIIHGQVFARDFFEVMGPGTFYWLAAFFKLFGVSFQTERLCLFVTSLGTALLMYFLSRRICSRYQALPYILFVSTSFGALWPVISHHADSNFFALLSVACVVVWHDTRRHHMLLAAGVMAAVTTCVLQPKGMFLMVAILLWLAVQKQRRFERLSAMGLVVASYCWVIGLVLFYFWSQGALRDLFYANVVWPSHHYGAVNAVPYAQGILQYWNHWAVPVNGVRLLIWLAPLTIAPFLLVAALPVMLFLLGFPRLMKQHKPEILLYWLCGWALWLSEIHRKDLGHLVVGSSLLIILCIYFLTQCRGRIADSALQLLTISSCTLAAVNLLILATAHTVPTRSGSVAMFQPDPVIAFLDQHTAPGDEIFTYPYCPKYYSLTSTENPTRYSLLIYNYNTPSQFYETIQVLDQHKVKYVVWDTHREALASLFPASTRIPARGLLMEPYLESHYRQVQLLDGVRIMERKNDH